MIKGELKIHHYVDPLTTYTVFDATIDEADFFNFKFLPKNKRAKRYALKRLEELVQEFIDLEVIETDPLKKLLRRDRILAKGNERGD